MITPAIQIAMRAEQPGQGLTTFIIALRVMQAASFVALTKVDLTSTILNVIRSASDVVNLDLLVFLMMTMMLSVIAAIFQELCQASAIVLLEYARMFV